ncbi:GL25649 [Drosophila persimilis]|uniref:GL25649 n=1 Tax=Drosophila persimilis TaxID=7234 RepID=B4GUC5_DROPE|nr:GL25649 [Drosophila persimilis]
MCANLIGDETLDGNKCRYWLAARTTCTGATGAAGTLIKTGQSHSLAKDVPCIPASYAKLPKSSWANLQKPRNIAVHAMKVRRLLFCSDVGSHQAIRTDNFKWRGVVT